MSQLSVVIAGHVCIDHNRSEHANYTSWGSSTLYMAQVFTKQYGAAATVLANYGPDLVPYLLPSVVLMPREPSHAHTLIYENDTSARDGKRVQHCHNVDAATPAPLTVEAKNLLATADIVVLAVLLPNYSVDYVRELLACAAPTALKVLGAAQGYFRQVDSDGLVRPRVFDEAEGIVRQFDLVVYSEEDCPDAFAVAQNWKRMAPDTQIVVTQSSKGASIVYADHIELVPTIPIPPEKIVDSVGCGDTFAAALATAYRDTNDLVSAVKAAHKVAGKKLRTVTPKD